ncbi:hypothetical protein KQX54_015162 [Cotesia glomerata]|uniref:Laminin G domain-containing protein n=1 Tax=Cotesia glomerata TaxID=32391 RepID=A0AAV7J537_COTGL|nr:hypothetical protein KQX54_015162 [Cotesia glomerata]
MLESDLDLVIEKLWLLLISLIHLILFTTNASILHLNGSQQMTILMPEDSRTQAEEISLRFRTSQPNGLLFATSADSSSDCLQLYLDNGVAKMRIQIQSHEKVKCVL